MTILYTSPPFLIKCNIAAVNNYNGNYNDYPPELISSIIVEDFVDGMTYFSAPNGDTQYYSRSDVRIYDWISNDTTSVGGAWQIVGITNNPNLTATYTIIDVDGYCQTTGLLGIPGSQGLAYIFRLNEDGLPIMTGLSLDSLPSRLWQSSLIAHFAARNSRTQYVSINQVNTFTVGESIYIDSSGVFQKSAGSLKISDTVGIVTSKGIPSDDWFSFRPSGKYFDTSLVPHDFFPTPGIIEQVSGSNVTLIGGMKLYINAIPGGRQYTTVKRGSNAFATWILIDANRAIYIAGSGGGGGGGSSAVQVFDGGDPYWESAPPTTIYPVLDCGGI